MIDNDVYTFLVESVFQGYHKYKNNWPEGSKFSSASARGGRYLKIDIFAPEFAPQVSLLTYMQTLIQKSRVLQKMGINLVR